MPLFSVEKDKVKLERLQQFKTEKELQYLVEKNLAIIFNCRYVATEFPTGPKHAGRIDTLALSEDGNPVIIEYKKVESSDLINQSLFYLSWLSDHRCDFELAASKELGKTEIDWSEIRVICIAPGYKKYDLHAVQMMGANIELWQYKLFENGNLYLEEIFRRQSAGSEYVESSATGKNPKMVAAGKKAALTRATGNYTIENHIEKSGKMLPLFQELQSFILSLSDSIEEVPKKLYIAYKVAQNFVCIEVRPSRLTLYLKLDPGEIEIRENMRDVTNIGHYGTGNLEISIENTEQLEAAKHHITLAFEAIGG